MIKPSSDPQEHSAGSLRRNPQFPRQTRIATPTIFTEADFVDSSPSSLKRSYRPLSRALDSQRITPKYRPRFASLPHPIPSELQAQIDIDNDRIARGLASPPLTDFSTFEDTYRGPRGKGFEGLFAPSVEPKIKPILKRNRSLSAGVSNAQKTFSPLNLSSDRKPDPRRIVAALEQVLNLGPQDVGEHLDIHELLGMHQLDQLNFEERDAIRSQTFHGGRQAMQDLTVFGEHLRKVSIYASISVVLGGREHELPVVVVTAVEELYRKGIYQQPIPYSPQPCSSLPTHQHLRLTASARKRHSTPPNTIRGTTQSPGRFRSRYFTPSRVDPRYLRPPLHVPSIPSRTYPPSHPIPCPLGLVRGSGRNQRSRGTPSFL